MLLFNKRYLERMWMVLNNAISNIQELWQRSDTRLPGIIGILTTVSVASQTIMEILCQIY